MRTQRSPGRDTTRALFFGPCEAFFGFAWACVPCGIDGGVRTMGGFSNGSLIAQFDKADSCLLTF